MPTNEPDADELGESNRQSLEKVQSLVDDLKVVEEYEKNLLDEPKRPPSAKTRGA